MCKIYCRWRGRGTGQNSTPRADGGGGSGGGGGRGSVFFHEVTARWALADVDVSWSPKQVSWSFFLQSSGAV